MKLYETQRRAVVSLDAQPGSIVRMYVCGITPYDATHVGHAATFLAYDVLQRRLRDLGCHTRCVRNITDVDDDLLARARAMGVHYLDLAAGSLAAFDSDMAALGLLPADAEPRATSAITDIRRLIGRLLRSGHAYRISENVYFDISAAQSFGELSGLDTAEMVELARSRGGRPDDPDKRNPLDFVLWQRSAPGEPEWSSAWGLGRPGWHVECSALALEHLGETVDVHGGGSDLVFPHHECSRAQSEAATGRPFVRHWMHTSMVRHHGAKMSKSAGNLAFVADLRECWEPMAVRLALLGAHYRADWDWSPELVADAARRLERWRAAGRGDGALARVRARLDDDLDTPGALAEIDAAADDGEPVSDAAALLGVAL
ncbi:cysteine--tRNA ligase [Candidatus Poriferisodalis sp.]|uniref:cysteine--tRNA ligase n=1 Tax=Candidatus Poriferisodalis sp. TaxID=3101277 RepID=UPI003B02082E